MWEQISTRLKKAFRELPTGRAHDGGHFWHSEAVGGGSPVSSADFLPCFLLRLVRRVFPPVRDVLADKHRDPSLRSESVPSLHDRVNPQDGRSVFLEIRNVLLGQIAQVSFFSAGVPERRLQARIEFIMEGQEATYALPSLAIPLIEGADDRFAWGEIRVGKRLRQRPGFIADHR